MGECNAELLAIGGEHGMFALSVSRDGGDRFSSNSLFSFTIRREVARGSTMKTAYLSTLVGWLG